MFDLADENLAAEFNNLVNIDALQKLDTELVFDDIPVDEGGMFDHRSEVQLIRGGFFGADHVEVAGVVEGEGIVGSFGAIKAE